MSGVPSTGVKEDSCRLQHRFTAGVAPFGYGSEAVSLNEGATMDGIFTVVLFLGVCLAMHFFMHRGHGHGHGGHGTATDHEAADRDVPEPQRKHAGHGCH